LRYRNRAGRLRRDVITLARLGPDGLRQITRETRGPEPLAQAVTEPEPEAVQQASEPDPAAPSTEDASAEVLPEPPRFLAEAASAARMGLFSMRTSISSSKLGKLGLFGILSTQWTRISNLVSRISISCGPKPRNM
jgi:hypothetical protein